MGENRKRFLEGRQKMEKTYSQKVAAAFEVVSYGLMIPAAIGLLYAGILILMGLKNRGDAGAVLWGLVPFILTGIGISLLIGYRRHARGRLARKHIFTLWAATAVFNSLLGLPWLFSLLWSILRVGQSFGRDSSDFAYLSAAVVYIYGTIIYYALKAYASEKPATLR
jgi:hypothetical protein